MSTCSRRSIRGCSAIRAAGCSKAGRCELADWARDWYAKHGRPWFYARQAESLQIAGDGSIRHRRRAVQASGCRTRSARRSAQRDSGRRRRGPGSRGRSAAALARGKAGRIFLPRNVRSAVVEQLTTMAGARLCAWAEQRTWPCCRTTVPGIRSGTSPSSRDLLESDEHTRSERSLRPWKRSTPACCGPRNRSWRCSD